MTAKNEKPPWIDLAEQASKETDPRKLAALVQLLCTAIDTNGRPKDIAVRDVARRFSGGQNP